MNKVYIRKKISYLPNETLSNNGIKDYLGQTNVNSFIAKRFILGNNGYATQQNSKIAAQCIRGLFSCN